MSTMISRCRVAFRPFSAIQRESVSRAAVVAEAASPLRERLLEVEMRLGIEAVGGSAQLRLILSIGTAAAPVKRCAVLGLQRKSPRAVNACRHFRCAAVPSSPGDASLPATRTSAACAA